MSILSAILAKVPKGSDEYKEFLQRKFSLLTYLGHDDLANAILKELYLLDPNNLDLRVKYLKGLLSSPSSNPEIVFLEYLKAKSLVDDLSPLDPKSLRL